MSDPQDTVVTHVVLLEARTGVDGAQLDRAFDAVRQLNELPGVRAMRLGPDISVEGLQESFTHAIVIEFDDTTSRDVYLRAPEHVGAADMLSACVARIVVVDV